MVQAGPVTTEQQPARAAEATDPAGTVRRGLALLVAGAMFMEILDGTVIAPAAPHIAADFGVPAVAVNVAVTAYVLTLAVLVPVSGGLADRFGARRIFLTAVLLFTVASAGCALAQSLPMLTATRVVQGAGGAMMVPVGRLAVLRTTAKTDLIRAIAYLTWPALVAPVVAPALGGLLATYASWRWIFVLNLPLGVAAAVLAGRLVPRLRRGDAGRLDWRGFGLTAVGVAALVVGLESVGSTAPDPVLAGTSLAVAAAVLTSGVLYLLRTPQPLVDLRILRTQTYRITAFGGSVYRALISAIPFLLPLFFQLAFGWTAALAGLVVIALFAGNVAIKPATTPLMRRFGIRTVMLAAIAGSAVCLAAMALLHSTTPLPLMIALLVASGIARSIGFSAYNSIAFADVPAERMTSANTLNAALQELGSGLGVAVGALLVRLGGALGLDASAGTPFRLAFLLLAAIFVVPAVEAFLLPRDAGAVVTGRG
jgi:EmrB/QacA subfamily drug resistance transporter